MLKNAAKAWGYTETEAENNFDPLVSMLLSACSVELEKISGEIHSSRVRVLERLVQLLSPDALTGASPAHAVGCAIPIDRSFELVEDDQYFVNKKIPGVSENDEPVIKDVFFSPTADFRLNRASIRFMATGNMLYRVMNGIHKETVDQSETGKELPGSTLWLGIDEPKISLKNTSFFFDLRNEGYKQLFFHQLPKATWYWNDQPMAHSSGYGERSISGEQLNLETILKKDDDITGKIKKHINAFYKSSFVCLLDKTDLAISDDNEMLAGIIKETFNGKSSKLLAQQTLRWICIDFPQTITSKLLQDVVCVMNAFPVLNRRLHDLTHRLQELINIIPLQTEDIFLDLEEVTDDEGKKLTSHTFQNANDDSIGLLLRNGGVGRFDERDASAIVDYLIQLLRDESAAFSSLGNDFMNNEMKQLQQIINKVEQRLFSRQVTLEQVPYLVLRNNGKASYSNIFIRYWSTFGKDANNIKAGTTLRLYKGSSVKNNEVLLVTTTIGGRNKLNNNESVLAYKSALLSKDRLVTTEDIKAFCHYQLGEKVKNVNVQKGIMIHPDESSGYIKTIDITIGINRTDFDEMMEKGEIGFWTENLKLLLDDKSLSLFPYRVYIQQAA
jgi:hypothetical protein